MNSVKKYLLLPSIVPLLVVIAISVLNINKPIRIKLLTWTSPSLGLGVFMILGSCTGALIASTSGLLLSDQQLVFRRDVHLIPNKINPEIDNDNNTVIFNNAIMNEGEQDLTPSYPPERDLRDPLPTLSIPFRVLKKKASQNIQYTKNNEYDQTYDEDFEQNYEVDYEQDYEEKSEKLDSDTNDNEYFNSVHSVSDGSSSDWSQIISEEW